ncbi:MAG TPA: O-antigen ligase family protein [Candidatus Acidoferrales bacterium]|nr:O-antigen ligase family protein [Candidatus Acidoferrales bacterium]
MQPVPHRIPPVVIVAAICLPAVVLFSSRMSPLSLFAGILGAFALVAAAVYRPAAFLAVPIFASQFKGLPGLRSVQGSVDLTLLSLCLAALVIFLHSVFGTQRVQLVPGRFTGSSKQITAFFFFALIVAASYLHTPAPQYGGEKLIRFLLIGTFFLLAPLYLINSDEDFRHFSFAFVILAIVQSFVLFARAGRVSSMEDTDVTRIGAGWVIGMAMLLLLFYQVTGTPFWRKVLTIVSLPILVAGLITSASRGAIFSTVIAAFFLLFKVYKGRSKAIVGMIALVALVCAGTAFYFLRNMGGGKYTEKADEIVQMLQGQGSSGTAAERFAFYQAAFREIEQRPLLGLGVGGWSVYYFGKDERAYPHDLPLEIATEEGLLGLFGFALFISAVYRASRELTRLTDTHFIVLSGLLLFTLMATMFSGDLDDDRVIWLWSGMTLAVLHFARIQFAELVFKQKVFWSRQQVDSAELVR